VKLFAGLSADFAQKVERGILDAAVVAEAPHPLPASLAWTALYREPMVMIAPRRPHFRVSPKPVEALATAPFIRFDSDTWTGHLVNRVLAQCRVAVREEMELNSVEAIVELVRQGFGVSIVPRLANVRWSTDRALRVIALPGVDVDRRVGLLERTHHARTRFTTEIKAYFHREEQTCGRRRRTA
jgi:DNA-binding transcriptional LysR family regulator